MIYHFTLTTKAKKKNFTINTADADDIKLIKEYEEQKGKIIAEATFLHVAMFKLRKHLQEKGVSLTELDGVQLEMNRAMTRVEEQRFRPETPVYDEKSLAEAEALYKMRKLQEEHGKETPKNYKKPLPPSARVAHLQNYLAWQISNKDRRLAEENGKKKRGARMITMEEMEEIFAEILGK